MRTAANLLLLAIAIVATVVVVWAVALLIGQLSSAVHAVAGKL